MWKYIYNETDLLVEWESFLKGHHYKTYNTYNTEGKIISCRSVEIEEGKPEKLNEPNKIYEYKNGILTSLKETINKNTQLTKIYKYDKTGRTTDEEKY